MPVELDVPKGEPQSPSVPMSLILEMVDRLRWHEKVFRSIARGNRTGPGNEELGYAAGVEEELAPLRETRPNDFRSSNEERGTTDGAALQH